MKNIKRLAAVAAATLCGCAFGSDFTTTGAEECASADGVGVYYKWTSGGSLTIPAGGKAVDVLLVGGGGAGGFCRGGGGGGGGVVYQEGTMLSEGTYTITVGAGGVPDMHEEEWNSGNCYQKYGSTEKTCGQSTVLSSATETVFEAFGGGGGGSFNYNSVSDSKGWNGGCGGGAAGKYNANAAVGSQGGNGGLADGSVDSASAGGGGAGGNGTNSSGANPGGGGIGYSCSITGEPVYYAGGGGGGAYGTTGGSGGAGGGGAAGTGENNAGVTAGTDGLGGGGGGASGAGNKWTACVGGAGGSGVVIIRATVGGIRPSLESASATLDGTTLTVSATLAAFGTSEDGSRTASSAKLLVGVGTDPDKLVFQVAKSDWTETGVAASYEVGGLSSYTRYFWAVRVENEFGYASREDVTGAVQTDGDGIAIPGVASIGVKTIPYTSEYNSGWFKGSNPFFAIDGDRTSRVDYNWNNGTPFPIGYDLGEPKRVGEFRMVFPGNPGDSYITRMTGLEVYGSNDRITWTPLTSQADIGLTLTSETWLSYPILANGEFRYYEVRGLQYGNVSEMAFVSEAMALQIDRPTVISGTELGATDDVDGVTVSGKLVQSPSQQAEVFGYCADVDYDADESQWAANGTKFEIGTFETNVTFSAKLTGLAAGTHYVRLFAKDGAVSTSSHRTWSFVTGTEAIILSALVSHDTIDLQRWYDGNTGNYCDNNTAGAMIFDLSGIPAEKTLAAIRVWPRNGGGTNIEWHRFLNMRVWASYDEGEIGSSGGTLVDGRDVFLAQGGDSAGTGWIEIPAVVADSLRVGTTVEDLVLQFPASRRPHYLKIDSVPNSNLDEIEFRTLPVTAAPAASDLLVTRADDSFAPVKGMLRYALASARDGDTVTFSPGVGCVKMLVVNDMKADTSFVIDKAVTIEGNGVVVDGGWAGGVKDSTGGRIFMIPTDVSGKVTIRNLTMQNGHGRGWNGGSGWSFSNQYFQGGAMCALSPVRFENCSFVHNAAADETAHAPAMRGGGAIYAESDVEISGCFFNGNEIPAGSTSYGGAILVANGMLTVENAVFDGDFSNSYGGGAITLSNGGLTICGTVFEGVRSSNCGGAIFVLDSSSPMLIKDSVFRNAYCSSENGGAIYVKNSGKAQCLTLANCEFSNISAGSNGGIVRIEDNAQLRAINCSFVNSSAVNWGSSLDVRYVGCFVNCTFTGAMDLGTQSTAENGGVLLFNSGSCFLNCVEVGNVLHAKSSDFVTNRGIARYKTTSPATYYRCIANGLQVDRATPLDLATDSVFADPFETRKIIQHCGGTQTLHQDFDFPVLAADPKNEYRSRVVVPAKGGLLDGTGYPVKANADYTHVCFSADDGATWTDLYKDASADDSTLALITSDQRGVAYYKGKPPIGAATYVEDGPAGFSIIIR